jgi:D-3-phosphoglycerate dehydrogenase / 2-oxoglutarate reductase
VHLFLKNCCYFGQLKPILCILDDWEGLIASCACWKALSEEVDIKFLDSPIDTVPESTISNCSFLMAIRERTALTDQLFSRMPKLKLVLQTGGHAYHIDQEAAEKRGILIALGRRAVAPLLSVPELTMALMLGVMHKLPQAQQGMRTGGWPLLTGRTLNSRRLGILGMGRHGSRVAKIAKNAFNMDVVAWARPGGQQTKDQDIPRLTLDELLFSSDVVSIHLRLSDDSTGLLNAERLQKMKPGSILINTSRGAIINEPALVDALKNGPLAGAGLDVFANEPLAADSPFRSLPNAMLTPHVGWTVEEVFREFAEIASTQLRQFLQGNLPSSEILPLKR